MAKLLSDRTAAKLLRLLNAHEGTGSVATRAASRLWCFVRCDSATAVGGNDILDQCYPATLLQVFSRLVLPPEEHDRGVLLTLLGDNGNAVAPVANRCYLALMGSEVESDASGGDNGRPRVFGIDTGFGDVSGPASSTDNAIARFDGTTGKLIQNSLALVDDNGAVLSPYSVGTSGGDSTLYNSGVLTNASAPTADSSAPAPTTTTIPSLATRGILWLSGDDGGLAWAFSSIAPDATHGDDFWVRPRATPEGVDPGKYTGRLIVVGAYATWLAGDGKVHTGATGTSGGNDTVKNGLVTEFGAAGFTGTLGG